MSSAKIWDRIADRYAKKAVPNEAVYQRKLAISQQYFTAQTRALEFGCGTGSTALVHASHVEHLHAIDISQRMIAIAQEKALALNVANVSFETTTIEQFHSSDASFDAVLGLSILHLLADKEAAIRKVWRLLKPGGVFISSTACLGDRLKYFKWIEPIGRRLGLMPMVKVFTQQNLIDAITDVGFSIHYQWAPESSHTLFLVGEKPA